ncbi:protease inhibitor I42 family protein [Mitsuaria sp. PDC51]|uniref:protease inhibitor I42 family protein n=1 Tax=Mitsuaria sp. PDC51 TaxID=1881035 RepID=UPI001587F788|nr:protease inhibitor I42 family protein [Mitsuaria sp. PDC51]
MLSVADNGKTIDLRVGHSVLLRLPENPSTGYGWTLDADPRLVEISEKRHVHSAETVGSGGESQWSIKAAVPGATTLRLKHWREWEGEGAVTERCEVGLVISA